MHLQKLSLVNFKNIEDLEVQFSPNLNCFIGDNGAGKTNLMDAIYYLSFCKSFLNSTDALNVNHAADFFLIKGDYQNAGGVESVHCGMKQGQKKSFKCNKKEYQRLADHIGRLPLIVVTPSDQDLIIGGSEERRKFIDALISQYDSAYLDALMRYNKVLLQRNKLLKQFHQERSFSSDSLEVWDDQLAIYGHKIHAKRSEYIEQLKPIFQHYYELISGGKEEINLQYKSQLSNAQLSDLLLDARDKDRMLQYTSVGVHRDDVEFDLGGYSLKKIGSQGQKKTYLVAIKLAQFDFVKQMSSITPIILLDDIFDKLDSRRVEQIVTLVAQQHFGQVFITDTNRENLDVIIRKLEADYKIFKVDSGCIQELENEEIKN
ncbi:MAG: DNA replication/repair protein RecF [Mangrovibacterium sp.]